MIRCRLVILAAAIVIGGATGAAAQAPRNESAADNVRQSDQYERLLCSNPSFRAKRIAQECSPISDPAMHQSCVASFQCGGPRPTGEQFRQAPPSTTIR